MLHSSAVLYYFQRTYTGTVRMEAIQETLHETRMYLVRTADRMIATLYAGDEFGILKLPDQALKISLWKKDPKKRIYAIADAFTGDAVGKIEYPSWLWTRKIIANALLLVPGEIYSLKEIRTPVPLFSSKTKQVFRYEMSGGDVTFFYTGKFSYTYERFFKKQEEEVFSGTIEAPGDDQLFPVMTGLYIIEENFRLERDKSAG